MRGQRSGAVLGWYSEPPSFYLLLDVFLLICLCAASSQENGTSDCSVPKRRGKMISEASEIFGQIISELPFN